MIWPEHYQYIQLISVCACEHETLVSWLTIILFPVQAAHLLESPKNSEEDITNISSSCFKLNSLQLRALLENYIPMHGEPHVPPALIGRLIRIAQDTADEMIRSDGRDVRLDEEPDLQLPFLLPEDGYSCDIVKGVPNGLAEFLAPLSQTGEFYLVLFVSIDERKTIK